MISSIILILSSLYLLGIAILTPSRSAVEDVTLRILPSVLMILLFLIALKII